eukprot:CAMPEP_0179445478 /NCGR_PEP_ID=MMETSP0799-20121207/28900_1 /TAXON_ID=46947 /ORGANISM="Geminigera cryophila, Strain CCMP2564" /LENGTH=196 /DNA_ID=CAMNT_0021233513 /DNA_START=69 /DNA_END=656 /DNA_ORIENTATION=-
MAPKSSVAMSRSTSGGVANQDRPVRGEEGVQRTGGKRSVAPARDASGEKIMVAKAHRHEEGGLKANAQPIDHLNAAAELSAAPADKTATSPTMSSAAATSQSEQASAAKKMQHKLIKQKSRAKAAKIIAEKAVEMQQGIEGVDTASVDVDASGAVSSAQPADLGTATQTVTGFAAAVMLAADASANASVFSIASTS